MNEINNIKGLESQFGLYVYENEALVDVDYDSGQDIKYTEIHENVHAILSLSSSYGLVVNMLKKISLIDTSKEWIRKELIDNMMSMQECISTCIEYLSILKYEGEEAYKLAYSQLKRDRGYKKYYKDIKNARWIMENATHDNVDSYISILGFIGRTALQIKFNEIPLEGFDSKQNMDKIMTIEANALKYHPNKRCNELLKNYKKVLNTEENIDEEEIIKCSKTINLILDCTANPEDLGKISKEFVLNIYKDSVLFDKVARRIKGFGESAFKLDSYDQSLAIYPTDLNGDKSIIYTTEFISLQELKSFIIKKSDSIFIINNRLAALEELHLVGYLDYESKCTKMTISVNQENIAEVIQLSQIPTVFLEKKRFMDYKYNLDKINFDKPIYIYLESAILYNIDFIREYFSKGIYTLISFDRRILMCIKKDNYITIQLISKNAIEPIKKVLKEYNIDIDYREWIVSGLMDLEKEIYIIDKYHKEFENYTIRARGDL